MDRQPLYFTILILTILIGSSFYLSWSVDRGMGDVSIERLTIETSPGHNIEILVYSPRTGKDLEPMPVMLTIHGLTGTKEGLYSFNVELARRNFTVVSLDLPGHGDSTSEFELSDTFDMALDAYVAVRHVQTTYPNVHNESYGVLTHSLGFRVALELKDFPVAPRAYVAVGDVGKISNDGYVDFPSNLLFAMGSFDEIVTKQDALGAIQTATGNASAEEGITYGSLDSQTAYRLAFGPSNHVFEVVDKDLVTEAVTWLVQGVQGEAQLLHTRDPTDLVYSSKTTVSILGTLFILTGVFPVMLLVYSFTPTNWKPKRFPLDREPQNYREIFLKTSVFGASVVIVFVATLLLGLWLEDFGIVWLRSMSGTGLALFTIVSPILLLILMQILHKENTKSMEPKELIADIMKGIAIAATGIAWVLFWLGVAGASRTEPGFLLVLVKWPVGIRWTNVFLLTVLSIPLFLIEAEWVREILPTTSSLVGEPIIKYSWSSGFRKTVSVLIALVFKFAVVALLTALTIFMTTSVGVSGGRIVLIGVIWVRVLIIQVFAAVAAMWASFEFENAWPTTIVSAFVLALVLVTTVPLI
jgi:pimeloyl-ACP methyl ester carboxylesterase